MAQFKISKNIVNEFDELFKYNAFRLANDLLIKASLRTSVMTVDKILSFAKASFPKKSELPDRKTFLDNARAEFVARKLNADELLAEFV